MSFKRKGDGALILSPIRKVADDAVTLGDPKRLVFAFKLSSKTLTLPKVTDCVIEVFNAFNRDRNTELTPDCISLQFESYSRKRVDLPVLYAQLKEFLNPFVSKKWHTPSLSINTHYTAHKESTLNLVLTWQDKTYEQLIRRPAATWRSER